MTPDEVNSHLKEIARFAKHHKKYDYEFWVTDSTGKVYYYSADTGAQLQQAFHDIGLKLSKLYLAK